MPDDAIIVAVIGAFAPVLAIVVAIYFNVRTIKHQTNSMHDKLMAQEFHRGMARGAEEEKQRKGDHHGKG
jgi:hypothetical protein